jgi:Protein of unknown function (DUF1565)
MGLTHFPHGVSSFGIPLVGNSSPISIPGSAGNVWFVDANLGTDGQSGGDPTQPFKTITKALAVAAAGDTIFIFPGSYDENVVVSKDYIALIGAQWAGYAKPDIEASSGVTLTVTGQGFMAQHCRFAGTADVVQQQGNGFLYTDCVFDGDGNGATTALLRLLPSSRDTHLTASEGFVLNSLFRGSGGLGIIFDTGAAPVGVGSSDNQIAGNIFRENTGIDIATAKTGAAGTYSVQFTVVGPGNIFEDKNKTTYIDITTNADGAAGSQSGTITGNIFASDTMTTTVVKMVGTAFTFPGNIDTVGVVDGSGLD